MASHVDGSLAVYRPLRTPNARVKLIEKRKKVNRDAPRIVTCDNSPRHFTDGNVGHWFLSAFRSIRTGPGVSIKISCASQGKRRTQRAPDEQRATSCVLCNERMMAPTESCVMEMMRDDDENESDKWTGEQSTNNFRWSAWFVVSNAHSIVSIEKLAVEWRRPVEFEVRRPVCGHTKFDFFSLFKPPTDAIS